MFVKGKGVRQRLSDKLSVEQCLNKCGAAVELDIGITLTAYVYSNDVNPEDLIIETIDLTDVDDINDL